MDFYCPNCKREYEDLSFKYCPVCLTKIVKKQVTSSNLNDIDEINSEINLSQQNIQDLELKLAYATDEDEIIELKYSIMKQKENINLLIKKRENLEDKEKRGKIFKKLYVTNNDEKIENIKKSLENHNYSTKEEVINFLTDYSYSEKYRKACEEFNSNNYESALNYLNYAVNECQSDIVWIYKGNCHNCLNEFDEGLSSFNEAIKIHPNSILAFHGKIISLIGLKQYKKALDYCNKVQFNKITPLLLVSKAIVYYYNELYEKSIEYSKRAIKLNPNDDVAWYWEASCHFMLGNRQDSIFCCEKSLQLNPNNNDAKRLLKQLKGEWEVKFKE